MGPGRLASSSPRSSVPWASPVLRIRLRSSRPRAQRVDALAPESLQPVPTLAERSAAAGLRIHHLGPASHEWSGLTRAIGRGERFHAADSLEAVTERALRLLNAPRTFVFGYHPRLDAAGHVHGVA